MFSRYKTLAPLILVIVALCLPVGKSKADLVEIGSATVSGKISSTGDTVSAYANFYYSTSNKDQLIIDLVNTTSKTLSPADVLVGLVFNMTGSPRYATSPTSADLSPSLNLTGIGTTSRSLGNGSFSNSWTNNFTSGHNSNLTGQYGFSTTSFGGAFNSTGIGSENDGIVGSGTTLTNAFSNCADQPLAVSGLELKLTFSGDISNSTLSNFQFLFGTDGTGILKPSVPLVILPLPEPSTFTIAGLSALGLLGYGFRRRSKS